MDYSGMKVVTSPYAPKGTVFLIDEEALYKAFEVSAPKIEFSEPQWGSTFDRMQFSSLANFRPTEVERDPMARGIPHTFRGVWRLMRDVFGYEWRKATGTLRRYPKPDPRRYAVLTGLTG